jgi:hypothetical protein
MSGIFKNPDMVSGAALIVFGAVATALSLDISRGPDIISLPPNFMPLICSVGIVLCGLVLLVRGFTSERAELPMILDRGSAGVAVALGFYFWFFDDLDFRLGTWALVLVIMLVMRCRSWKQLLIVPIATSAIIYVTFRYLFEILLPVWG